MRWKTLAPRGAPVDHFAGVVVLVIAISASRSSIAIAAGMAWYGASIAYSASL